MAWATVVAAAVRCAFASRAQDGRLLLHDAIYLGASEGVVAALLAAYPDAAKEKDKVRVWVVRQAWVSGDGVGDGGGGVGEMRPHGVGGCRCTAVARALRRSW